MKRFYAERNPYGVRCSYEGDGWQLFAFDSEADRDEFVARENEGREFQDRAAPVPVNSEAARAWRLRTRLHQGFNRNFRSVEDPELHMYVLV